MLYKENAFVSYTKKDAYMNLERVNFWISNCDKKASILIAVLGVLIGCTAFIFDSVKFIKGIIIGKIEAIPSKIVLLIFLFLFFSCFIIAVIFTSFHIYKTLKPKLDIDKLLENNKKLEKDSILYFFNIQNNNYNEFDLKTKYINEEKLLNDINSQCYINSYICTLKFNHLKKSTNWIMVTGALSVVIIILTKLI